MFSDLCVPISDALGYGGSITQSPAFARLRETLTTLQRLGYGCAALEYTTTLPLRQKDACKRLPPLLGSTDTAVSAPRTGSASEALSAAASVVLGGHGAMPTKRAAKRLARAAAAEASAAVGGGSGGGGSSSSSSNGGAPAGRKRGREDGGGSGGGGGGARAPRPFLQLHRITVEVEGGGEAVIAQLRAAAPTLSGYDIVTAVPRDGAALAACVAAAARGAPLDALVVDATSSAGLPFPLSRADAKAAAEAGLVFELRYAPALRDSAARRAFLACAAALRRATGGGAALALASGARGPLEVRAPGDVGAVAGLAGWPQHAAAEALAAAPAAALARAAARKTVGGAAGSAK
jgi:RNase P/RNase MRP subunit p30